eukprot:TRINITY_DN2012_c0_g1_i2.p1 TRINITY_DN2012_c0_g1~~TRINITY_DN2012_c0_g1_i2.p1  ORF type:complete len:1168 (-),score=322.26 TRINITY_DN2012_c0_g1_i2:1331-4639(-)
MAWLEAKGIDVRPKTPPSAEKRGSNGSLVLGRRASDSMQGLGVSLRESLQAEWRAEFSTLQSQESQLRTELSSLERSEVFAAAEARRKLLAAHAAYDRVSNSRSVLHEEVEGFRYSYTEALAQKDMLTAELDECRRRHEASERALQKARAQVECLRSQQDNDEAVTMYLQMCAAEKERSRQLAKPGHRRLDMEDHGDAIYIEEDLKAANEALAECDAIIKASTLAFQSELDTVDRLRFVEEDAVAETEATTQRLQSAQSEIETLKICLETLPAQTAKLRLPPDGTKTAAQTNRPARRVTFSGVPEEYQGEGGDADASQGRADAPGFLAGFADAVAGFWAQTPGESAPAVQEDRATAKASGDVYYLPMEVRGAPVLQHVGENSFLVDNSILRAASEGLLYRASKSDLDRTQLCAAWGSVLQGTTEMDGWLAVDMKKEVGAAAEDKKNEVGAAAAEQDIQKSSEQGAGDRQAAGGQMPVSDDEHHALKCKLLLTVEECGEFQLQVEQLREAAEHTGLRGKQTDARLDALLTEVAVARSCEATAEAKYRNMCELNSHAKKDAARLQDLAQAEGYKHAFFTAARLFEYAESELGAMVGALSSEKLRTDSKAAELQACKKANSLLQQEADEERLRFAMIKNEGEDHAMRIRVVRRANERLAHENQSCVAEALSAEEEHHNTRAFFEMQQETIRSLTATLEERQSDLDEALQEKLTTLHRLGVEEACFAEVSDECADFVQECSELEAEHTFLQKTEYRLEGTLCTVRLEMEGAESARAVSAKNAARQEASMEGLLEQEVKMTRLHQESNARLSEERQLLLQQTSGLELQRLKVELDDARHQEGTAMKTAFRKEEAMKEALQMRSDSINEEKAARQRLVKENTSLREELEACRAQLAGAVAAAVPGGSTPTAAAVGQPLGGPEATSGGASTAPAGPAGDVAAAPAVQAAGASGHDATPAAAAQAPQPASAAAASGVARTTAVEQPHEKDSVSDAVPQPAGEPEGRVPSTALPSEQLQETVVPEGQSGTTTVPAGSPDGKPAPADRSVDADKSSVKTAPEGRSHDKATAEGKSQETAMPTAQVQEKTAEKTSPEGRPHEKAVPEGQASGN